MQRVVHVEMVGSSQLHYAGQLHSMNHTEDNILTSLFT